MNKLDRNQYLSFVDRLKRLKYETCPMSRDNVIDGLLQDPVIKFLDEYTRIPMSTDSPDVPPERIEDQIEICAMSGLKTAFDDYAARVWSEIGEDVIRDVKSATEPDDGFTRGDVALAVGRAISRKLGIET